MRRTVTKKIRKMMPKGYTPKDYRKAKAIYKGSTQHPKLKVSRRQKRLAGKTKNHG